METAKETFMVWILPESQKILVTDRADIPVECCNVSEYHKRFLVRDSVCFDGFTKWGDAVDYANDLRTIIYLQTYADFGINYDNEAGRWAEAEIRLENGEYEED